MHSAASSSGHAQQAHPVVLDCQAGGLQGSGAATWDALSSQRVDAAALACQPPQWSSAAFDWPATSNPEAAGQPGSQIQPVSQIASSSGRQRPPTKTHPPTCG